jgi:predicted DNA-binding WGR domain protein
MKKQLTYKDDKSDKFWSIETNGNSFTVTYGKVGTSGASQTKTFKSEYECENEAEKLVKEKVKKGYAERASDEGVSADYLEEWEDIVKAKDLTKALIKHFSYLADNPEFMPALAALMGCAKKAEIKDNLLIVKLNVNKGDYSLAASRNREIFKASKELSSFDEIS